MTEILAITARGQTTWLPVFVQPGASRDTVRGVFDGALKVAVKAPPVDGAANERCRKFLARQVLGCSTSQVVLEKGSRSRRKVFRIEDVPRETVQARLEALVAGHGVGGKVVVTETG